MEEKILQTKKNGMVMLLLTLLGYAVTVLLFFYSIILLDESLFPGILLTILSIAYWVAGIFLLCGLKVLKPQEALVLTLFGDYIGTLKGQGFYWVNPFCTRAEKPPMKLTPQVLAARSSVRARGTKSSLLQAAPAMAMGVTEMRLLTMGMPNSLSISQPVRTSFSAREQILS